MISYSCSPRVVCQGSRFDITLTFDKYSESRRHQVSPMTELGDESSTDGEVPTEVKGVDEKVEA